MSIFQQALIGFAASIGSAASCFATDECPHLLVQTGEGYRMQSFVLFSVSPTGGLTCQPKVAIARRLSAGWDAEETPLHNLYGCEFAEDEGESDSECILRELSYPLASDQLTNSVSNSAYGNGDVPWRPDITAFAEAGMELSVSQEPRWGNTVLGPRFFASAQKSRSRNKWYWPTIDSCGGCTAKDPVYHNKDESTAILSIDEVAYDIIGPGNTGAMVDLTFLVEYDVIFGRREHCPDALTDYLTGGATHAQKVIVTAHMADSSTQVWTAFDGRVAFENGLANNAHIATAPALDFSDLTDMYPSPSYFYEDCLLADPQYDVTWSVATAYGDTSHYFEGEVCRIVIRREYAVDGGADDPPLFDCEIPASSDVPCGREMCDPQCPPCAADFDMNGGVDASDLDAFIAAWELGDPCTDLDGNGGVDSADLAIFFSLFQLGGCD